MKVFEGIADTARLCGRYRAAGLSIGFVPTMGALHAGHVSLFERARSECERVVASIFVNPTQFGPGEDLAAYPRTPGADIAACRQGGVDLVLLAREKEVYPAGFQTWVQVEDLSRPLCGARRPVHFRGVATVVTQLLQIVTPHRAYFGAKDYQQCRIVERLVKDLHLPAEIRVVETMREADGLAMSSRNVYLDAGARRAAPRIHRALRAARDLVLAGETRASRVLDALREALETGPDLRVDYAEVRDAATLEDLPGGLLPGKPGSVLIAVAVFAGKTRLIDNVVA
ncbi:MAG TPA: pantoate--beta-alanine ligase [Planctomycetota bacterium]|nr:pantoate--beta-alanine ligase [Planctomycetota bacterium]